ncbi:MAG TPA: ABC transporter permease [Caulobacteraceae bacterium]|nr:ABC transporter permease [Caulobacteraceae bacterium]
MHQPADFKLEERDGGRTAVLTGDWTAVWMGEANERLEDVLRGSKGIALDLTDVNRCDTSGAFGILRAMEMAAEAGPLAARSEIRRLLELVDKATAAPRTPPVEHRSFYELFERIGRGVVGLFTDAYDTMAFNGHLIVAVGRAAVAVVYTFAPWLFVAMKWSKPQPIRWAAVFALAERAGLDATPIVATTTFFIGAVVGLVGANMLVNFGAQVFDVDLVGISVLREFNILITALLLAGRSASSFAAEIGAMKMNQEIDAMQVLGIDPFDALVFPRFAALLFTIPLLTFVATLAGLAGGLTVAWTQLDISPTLFYERMIDYVGVRHFWVGMSKAPVLAVVIAGIGCRQGMEVGGDVESLGRRVTAAVVHAIFATILIDAVFALIYMKLDL